MCIGVVPQQPHVARYPLFEEPPGHSGTETGGRTVEAKAVGCGLAYGQNAKLEILAYGISWMRWGLTATGQAVIEVTCERAELHLL